MQQASVAELPFKAEQFDVVTAFETVYFWPELAQNFREVYRVLKPGGVFFICNEANGETTKDDKWTQIIDGMTIYTDTALKEYAPIILLDEATAGLDVENETAIQKALSRLIKK